jgi:hypothetical protein
VPEEMAVEKDAKIFEAGEYPDKGITITESDLDTIVSNFTEAPVKVEHTDNPLDPLGLVKRVWRKGKDLFGRLAFPGEIAAFLERRGIRKLSVALLKDPLSLAEVSIVMSPRITDAAMFSDEMFTGDMRSGSGNMEINAHESKFALRRKEVDARLANLKADGKLVPASEDFAREILLKGDGKISFADGIVTVSELFERFLEAQPKVISFGDTAPASKIESTLKLSPEDEELISRLGISREKLERYI